MTPEKTIDLLLAEYLQLQRTVEDFDGRALTIKAWSVTLSAAGLGAAYVHSQPFVLVISGASALLFWLVEASWKVNQQAYYLRIRDIESAMKTNSPAIAPLQIATAWSLSWHKNWKDLKLLRAMVWLHVWLPHVPVAIGAGILFRFFPPTIR